MTITKCAVLGAGRLGGFHARLLSQMPDVELVAVVDPNREARCGLAELVGAEPLASAETLASRGVEAAVVAAPTHLHRALGLPLLAQGVHLLIEKPLALDGAEADELVDAARAGGCVLQVGHVERFNPAFEAAAERIGAPRFIEAERRSGFTFRSTDIGVVLDLMIHDLDLALSLTSGEIVQIDACGAALLGGEEDVASARLVASDGCVIQLTASRVSHYATRRMNVWGRESAAVIDFGERSAHLMTISDEATAGRAAVHEIAPGDRADRAARVFTDLLPTVELPVVEEVNPIQSELLDFLSALRGEKPPRVDGATAAAAVHVADRILDALGEHDFSLPSAAPILRPPQWHERRDQREAG